MTRLKTALKCCETALKEKRGLRGLQLIQPRPSPLHSATVFSSDISPRINSVPSLLPLLHAGKEHADKYSDGVKVQVFLLFNEKQSFRKLGDIIYQQSKSGEIYVRRDALTVIFDNNRILYGNLVTYGGNGLRRLWDLVFADGSTLLGKGLVALGLQSAAIIWLNNKPKELGNIIGKPLVQEAIGKQE